MRKNIKWILLGALGFILFLSLVSFIVYFVLNMMKGDAYQQSLATIQNNQDVIARIGTPITPSWYVLGSISSSGPNGTAALQYAINGSISSGKVYLYATKFDGQWNIDRLTVSIDGSGERITLQNAQ